MHIPFPVSQSLYSETIVDFSDGLNQPSGSKSAYFRDKRRRRLIVRTNTLATSQRIG